MRRYFLAACGRMNMGDEMRAGIIERRYVTLRVFVGGVVCDVAMMMG